MNENLIVEDNTIYEIDPECLRRKREQQSRREKENKREENRKEKTETEGVPKKQPWNR